ncbi:MAG: universal stress protein [Alphaproteobacteria bacterium]|jgi:nucleotide-binding universal stress UspA family protein
MYRAILTIACGDASDRPALQSACALAATGRAVVRVLPVLPDLVGQLAALGSETGAIIPQDVYDGLIEARAATHMSIVEDARAAAAEAGLTFGEGPQSGRLMVEDLPDELRVRLANAAPLADLVVSGQATAAGPLSDTGAFADALLHARAPMLLARRPVSALNGVAVIAWDGSPEAGRAVRSALPLLHQAKRVAIVQCPHGLKPLLQDAARPERLTHFLSLHGIAAAAVAIAEGRSGGEGECLLEAAKAQEADLLVAGAYGHWRLFETLFGGATRSFLDAESGPNLFLAH